MDMSVCRVSLAGEAGRCRVYAEGGRRFSFCVSRHTWRTGDKNDSRGSLPSPTPPRL